MRIIWERREGLSVLFFSLAREWVGRMVGRSVGQWVSWSVGWFDGHRSLFQAAAPASFLFGPPPPEIFSFRILFNVSFLIKFWGQEGGRGRSYFFAFLYIITLIAWGERAEGLSVLFFSLARELVGWSVGQWVSWSVGCFSSSPNVWAPLFVPGRPPRFVFVHSGPTEIFPFGYLRSC